MVTNAATPDPECFIMKPNGVGHLAHRREKDWRISYWLQPSKHRTDAFRETWNRIGRGDVALMELATPY
jgi:hypothetical protein